MSGVLKGQVAIVTGGGSGICCSWPLIWSGVEHWNVDRSRYTIHIGLIEQQRSIVGHENGPVVQISYNDALA